MSERALTRLTAPEAIFRELRDRTIRPEHLQTTMRVRIRQDGDEFETKVVPDVSIYDEEREELRLGLRRYPGCCLMATFTKKGHVAGSLTDIEWIEI